VVKNAAGFDLPKLMVGSLGRLGVMVELTFKVFPRPPAYATLAVDYSELSSALDSMHRLAVAPLDIEAVDLEPLAQGYQLWVRIAGLPEHFPPRLTRLQKLAGDGHTMEGSEEAGIWQDTSAFHWAPPHWHLIKVPITPRQIPAAEEMLRPQANVQRRYSVGGNVLWLARETAPPASDLSLSRLQVAGLQLRGTGPHPLIGTPPGASFARRVKRVLDPHQRFPET
jgi:glycolate oxidase FAD binding subunit